ncbi:HD domain-containing protein [Fusibacter paucivorans]|uniref:HD domain-containing protein n=1 Tax=Fusibacter paucivorans TaxID=76009 RepID=A0ABS5PKI5_9FIRM|nr:HD domain-containing phosphohydrolase [Fusibacter paucivorans]MBS7525402.1 HD domain-containing protein [Fusibacter paucivorans]
MHKQYKAVITDPEMIFENAFSKFQAMYQFDVCHFFLLDEHKKVATIFKTLPNRKEFQHTSNIVDISANDTYLNIVCESKSVLSSDEKVLFYNDHCYNPLNIHMEHEFYLPVLADQDGSLKVIGCIYLGFLYHKPKITYKQAMAEIDQTVLGNVLNAFTIQYKAYHERNRFFSQMNIFSEIYNNQYAQVNHPYNVAYWSTMIAAELNLSETEHFNLYIASILHDIGTLYLPNELINKSEVYDDVDTQMMHMHTLYGANIVKELAYDAADLSHIAHVIRHHHERYDGMGYPDGLKDDSIPLFSRVICVADSLDAMLSDRKYKKSKTLSEVIAEFKRCSGKQFDPKLTDIIVKIIGSRKVDLDHLIGAISWGTLLFTTPIGFNNVQGDVIKTEHGYKFITNHYNFDDESYFNKTEITNCSLVLFRGGALYEFIVKFRRMHENTVYISDLVLKPIDQYFALYWQLSGQILMDRSQSLNMTIQRIGGNAITFYLYTETLKEIAVAKEKLYHLNITFDDGETLAIPGQISRSYKSAQLTIFDFEYKSISEGVRDKIFRQIFKKQSEQQKLR